MSEGDLYFHIDGKMHVMCKMAGKELGRICNRFFIIPSYFLAELTDKFQLVFGEFLVGEGNCQSIIKHLYSSVFVIYQ